MKYFARVVRPRFEVTYVEVELPEGGHVRRVAAVAVERARAADTRWDLRDFDPAVYQPHVEMVMSDKAMEAEGETPEEGREWMRSAEGMADDRYLVLHADIGMGEGRLLTQPWVRTCHLLLIDDIAGDWHEGLTGLVEDIDSAPHGQAEVVPFRHPQTDDGSERSD